VAESDRRRISPARSGTVLLIAKLIRKDRAQLRKGNPGSRMRSIHHQRRIRMANPAVSDAKPSSNGPGRASTMAARMACHSKRNKVRPKNVAATVNPSSSRNAAPCWRVRFGVGRASTSAWRSMWVFMMMPRVRLKMFADEIESGTHEIGTQK